ncbi:3-deoxy-manno-octulosonate cytidylyltransferase [Prochlorococcus sp. AH-716-M06]|nr:3-deoxy-manno-octulosonate cytidylyltransferase [Prochlorococcus sp. AH-716-M06]
MDIKSESCIIIPARFGSSRFPGKPLIEICGKTLIQHVIERCMQVLDKEDIYLATDHEEIAEVAKRLNVNYVFTNTNALTGTDRVAEATYLIQKNYSIIVNVQGDEPLVSPSDIKKCINLKKKNPSRIVNGFSNLDISKVNDLNIPKVLVNEKNELIYISRNPLPGIKEKSNKFNDFKKQVCIYGFNKDELIQFLNFGRKSRLEEIEDIEILRFLELDKKILMFECQECTQAVDVPDDVIIVERILSDNNGKFR